METQVFKKVCGECGKEIASLSESQCNYNFQIHKIACDKKKEKK